MDANLYDVNKFAIGGRVKRARANQTKILLENSFNILFNITFFLSI